MTNPSHGSQPPLHFVIRHARFRRPSLRLAVVLAAAVLPLNAGEITAAPGPASAGNSGDWCDWLGGTPGRIHADAEHPYLQSLRLIARLHWQASAIDGRDVNGARFHDTDDDWRRFRVGGQAEFLRFFSSRMVANWVLDGRPSGRDLDWGYHSFDEATLSFDLRKALEIRAFDSMRLTYGRHKFVIGEEVAMSSNEMPMVERSAIANKVYGANSRPTGLTLDFGRDGWQGTLGLFSGEDDSDFVGGWNDGLAWYAALKWKSGDFRYRVDGVLNREGGSDDFLGYGWAGSFNTVWERDRSGLLASLIAGDNGSGKGARGGSFGGLTLMPWYWLVEDRLQAVVSYHLGLASEPEGLRANSRYLRTSEDPARGTELNGGRGDELHTIYAGLNWHLCGQRMKLMGGVEYSHLATPAGDAEALTWLIAFRTWF